MKKRLNGWVVFWVLVIIFLGIVFYTLVQTNVLFSPPNLITNPSFETGLTGWYKSSDLASVIDVLNIGATYAPDGVNVLRIRQSGFVNQNPSQLINAQGKTFSLTFSAVKS